MAELAEVIRENFGKSSYQMRSFFQKMIKDGDLEAYSVEVNKKTVEKDTEDEEVVRIKKGATLTPIAELREHRNVFVEDSATGVMYNLDIGSRGGMLYDDGEQDYVAERGGNLVVKGEQDKLFEKVCKFVRGE